jgi:hypothetical protein
MNKGVRTLRGSLQPNEVRQLVVDDGIFTNGLRIDYFTVWTSDIPTATSVVGCLSLNDTIIPTALLPANDPSVFAWSMMTMGTPATLEINAWERIDPDHIVNEELFIHNRASTQLEYLIVAEPYFMTEDEGVLQLVKGKQQAV